jgi:hypothetical protein
VCTEFSKDKEFRAFEMLEKIELSSKPRRCGGVAAVRHPPSKFIARSTEFTAFGAVILKCALELFFHGAHSMHMPQNSFVSVMPSSSSRSANESLMSSTNSL